MEKLIAFLKKKSDDRELQESFINELEQTSTKNSPPQTSNKKTERNPRDRNKINGKIPT